MRILCLHGYQGSAQVLRQKLAPLAAGVGSQAELVFIDAPSRAVGDYGWWHARADGEPAFGDPGADGPRRRYEGWQRTRAALIATFERLGPFDGVLGFSQGAALAGLLVGLRATGQRSPDPERPLRFDFAIMIGGFVSNDPELARLYQRRESYALPSLHVFGRADGIVPVAQSRALAAHFVTPVCVEHAGGHVIASEPAVQGAFRGFLETTNRHMKGKRYDDQ